MTGNLSGDIRYALRVLRRSPAFTVTAIVTLMLGIGANVVVFGVANAVLLRPLEVSDPGNLYQLRHQQWASFRLLTTSYPAFEDLRERNTTFSEMAGIYGYSRAALRWRNAVLSVAGNEVTGNYFDLLGVQPQAGRFFHAADEHGPRSAPYVVLSDSLWRRSFQTNRNVVGSVVQLNKHPFTVVGVAPPKFHGTERFVWPDYWMPMLNEEQVEEHDYLHNRTSSTVTVIGRLKPGTTPKQATQNLNGIAAQLGREHSDTDDGQPLRLIHPGLYGDEGEVIRGFLLTVTLLALLVLAAACANLATLFAARVADRRREMALRVALGAGAGRLMTQLLTEAVLVSIAGGAAGLWGAYLLLDVLNRWESPYGRLEVSVDARVYLVSLAVTFGSALLFGLLPARRSWRVARPVRRFAPRDLLLGAQIAVCTLLVTASLVAARGMVRVLHVPLGITPPGAVLADLDSHLTPEQERGVIDAVRGIAGVTAAGTVNRTPMTGGIRGTPVFRPGTVNFRLKDAALSAYAYQLSPGYREAAGTRLLNGRDVTWHDTAESPRVALVNETFARKMWGMTQPLGERFVVSGSLTEVVGVVEAGKYHDLQEAPQAAFFVPRVQSQAGDTVLVVRSVRAAGELAAAVQRAIGTPVAMQSWPESLKSQLFAAWAATAALGVLGLLAAMLAVTGIFGMAAYSVSRRTKELGIRAALGARAMQTMRAAVGRPVALLGAGSAVGLLAGIFASRLLEQVVYQANPADPLVLGGAALTMALLGVAASAIPALRALAIDPSRLMRDDT